MILDNTILLSGEQSKKTVFASLVQHFADHIVPANPQTLFDQFWHRELLGSTGIGAGVAIPHIRSAIARETHVVMIRLEMPIDFAGIDKQPVDLVMGMMFPNHDQEQNLEDLKRVANFFYNPKNRQFIRDAEQTVTIEYLMGDLFNKETVALAD